MPVIAGELFFGEGGGRWAATGDSRDDADDRIFFYGRMFLLQVPDIVVADKNIDIGTDITAFVQQVFLQVGEIQGKLLYSVVHRAGADLEPGCIVGKFPERS